MSIDRTLAVVGANEETIAHLRLLLRQGAAGLKHRWHWGSEFDADFVVVEPSSLACQGVQARCQAAGVPCAVLCDADEVVVQGLVLRRPFKLAQVVAVFNAAGASLTDKSEVEAFSEDFYVRELEAFEPPPRIAEDDVWSRRERPQATARAASDPAATPASDLDTLIHGDPLVEPEAPKRLINADTWVEPSSSEPSRRSESRAQQSMHRVVTDAAGVGPLDTSPMSIPPRADDQLRDAPTLPPLPSFRSDGIDASEPRLIQYVDGELLRSPSRLWLDELPAVILDPKARLFHIDCDLSELAVYWRQSLPRLQVKTVSTPDLTRARAAMPGRSYDELRWLDVLLVAGGRLNSKLDPGGSFCVRQPVAIDAGFRAHGRIVAAMATPARAHEIAAVSSAPMEQVFDIINAYELIGRLQWTPRQRRFGQDDDDPKPPGGKLSRLKWPFGKR